MFRVLVWDPFWKCYVPNTPGWARSSSRMDFYRAVEDDDRDGWYDNLNEVLGWFQQHSIKSMPARFSDQHFIEYQLDDNQSVLFKLRFL